MSLNFNYGILARKLNMASAHYISKAVENICNSSACDACMMNAVILVIRSRSHPFKPNSVHDKKPWQLLYSTGFNIIITFLLF